MKKIGIMGIIITILVGIGFLNWFAAFYCLNCFGTVPYYIWFF